METKITRLVEESETSAKVHNDHRVEAVRGHKNLMEPPIPPQVPGGTGWTGARTRCEAGQAWAQQ